MFIPFAILCQHSPLFSKIEYFHTEINIVQFVFMQLAKLLHLHRLSIMHHQVRMRCHLLWTSSFMCQRTVIKSVPTLKAAIAVLVSVVIDCLLMENPV